MKWVALLFALAACPKHQEHDDKKLNEPQLKHDSSTNALIRRYRKWRKVES